MIQAPDTQIGYIRHPPGIPLRLGTTPARGWPVMDLLRHARGGVCISSPLGYRPGTVLEVRVRAADAEHRFQGQVVWCRALPAGFELGLGFDTDESAFRARMIEQLCHIEAFRIECAGSGLRLTREQAAREWVARFSGGFPQIGGCRVDH